MPSSILGTRIRQRRREIGISQADLARTVGISPSYLNLIEWNKRRIAGTLLRKTAEALKLSLGELDDISERRLLDTLVETAHLPALANCRVEEDRASELIGRFPGWARALAALVRSEREATTRARNLSDRLSNDPFLNETVHRMLTRISAVRSASEILNDYPDAPEERREGFIRIVHDESQALSEVGEALAAYLDKAEETAQVLTPVDEVEALFQVRRNHFAELEMAAKDLAGLLTDDQPISRREKAAALAHDRLSDMIDATLGQQPQIETTAARNRARSALLAYGTGAILMPMDTFAERAEALAYDVEALADAFSAEFDAVCHRLTALSPEADVPKFGYFRANAAGTIVEMLSLDGLSVPRYAAACPLWVLYRTQQSPEMVIRQRALFPSGQRFVFVARARNTGPTGFGKPRHYLTDMIAMSETDAARTVYGPESSAPVEEVGPSCRMCQRRHCLHRVEDPLSE